MSLKRNPKGDFILRFRTGGRGSKFEYHNLGPVSSWPRRDAEREGTMKGRTA
jgi:hypothetical protein